MNILFVALGGFFGSICRYSISRCVKKKGTWIANISGSLLLAIVFKMFHAASIPASLWLFLGIGFCGAYTTYSTFSYETVMLIIQKKFRQAFTYVISSFTVSLVLVALVFILF